MRKKIAKVNIILLFFLFSLILFSLSYELFAQAVPTPILPSGPTPPPANVRTISWSNFLIMGLSCFLYGIFRIINRDRK